MPESDIPAPPFKDHFSGVSSTYATFRPNYPPELFNWLANLVPDRTLAWDCATGSGQAAIGLAKHFPRVIATDASAAQIASAEPHAGVEYRVASAEKSGLADGCADLVTVAQGLHWFDVDRFYAEARRVLKPDGLLAAWTYGIHTIENETIDRLTQHFYHAIVGPYWPPERKLVETGYRTLPFPFEENPAPAFRMEAHWSLPQLAGYLRSWSATSRYITENGDDPIEALEQALLPLWGDPGTLRKITWPLSIRAGR